MLMTPEHLAVDAPPSSADAIKLSLQKVLLSKDFGRAQRMRELLHFLVLQKLSGSQRETHEYAVGIEVFKRNPATYNTCNDPIVRVQVGRLRERLRAYYADAGRDDQIRFTIPVGSYMPEIAMAPPCPPPAPASIARHYLLAHCALMFFDEDAYGAAFTRGLNEELVHQLYCAFGATIVPHTGASVTASVSHRLEGSVRIDSGMVRLALRLVDNSAGSMVWSQQFDGHAALSIELQDQLAAAACAALNEYFAHG